MYYSFVLLGEEDTFKYRELAMKALSTDNCDYYYRKKPDVFHKIDNWYFVRAMFWRVKRIQSDYETGKIDADLAVAQIAGEFKYRLDAKVLDEARIRKHAQELRMATLGAIKQVHERPTK